MWNASVMQKTPTIQIDTVKINLNITVDRNGINNSDILYIPLAAT